MITLQEWFEEDPAKKDIEWAQKIVSYMRIYMQYVVNPQRAYTNMQWLLGEYPTQFLRDMFKTPEKAGVEFSPMAILEKARNVIISSIQDAGIHVELKAIDQSATNERKEDRNILANRKLIEATITQLRDQIGLPPYSLKDEKQPDGKKVFNGNTESFDEMGMDDSSDEDLDHFFNTFFRLTHEIHGEDAINYFIEYNNTKENLALWVDDILAKKAIFQQQYVNESTGAIEYKYVAPETVRAIMGRKRDFSDSQSIGVERRVSVGEFLQMVGSDFDYERDFPELITAVNYTNNLEYTGVNTDGYLYYGGRDRLCNWDQFMQFKVAVGYIEWRSVDGSSYKATNNNFHGNVQVRQKPWGTTESPNSIYKRQAKYNEVIYKAYYLITSAVTQKLYKYGKLAYQQVEGANDEYANFSISGYKEVGRTVVEVARKYMILIEKAFVKFEHMVMKALPPGYDYNYDSLMAIARKLMPGTNGMNSVNEVVNFMEDSANKLHIASKEDGKPINGGGQVNFPLANGLAPAVMEFQNVINWGFAQIDREIGTPSESVYNPQPRDVAKLQATALDYSSKATGYIPRIIMNVLDNTAKRTLLSIQDIIQFKDKNSLPYKFLLTALGDKVMADLESLGKVAMHRYGIFVMSFNSYQDKLKMDEIATQAYMNKELAPEQLLLITSISNPKKASMVLAYEKRRNERKAMQMQQQAQQAAMQAQQQINDAKMQQIQTQGQLELQKVDLQGQWDYKVEELKVTGEVDKTKLKIDAKPEEINHKTEGNIQQTEAKANIEQQAALNP